MGLLAKSIQSEVMAFGGEAKQWKVSKKKKKKRKYDYSLGKFQEYQPL